MPDTFHGVRVFQGADPVIAQPVSTSVIGMMMAVDPADLPSGFAVNTPVAIRQPTDATGLPPAVLQELDTVWDNQGGQVILTFVDEGADAAEKATNATGSAVALTGVHAFKKAGSLGLEVPKLLCIPGVATAKTGTADPVVAEAITVANAMRAQLYVDGPNTTIADAKAAAALIGDEKRVCISDPYILKSVSGTPTAQSSATLFAAIQSRLDRTKNTAWAATNQLAAGIVGVNRPTDYQTEATELNEGGVNTIINKGQGFTLWGPVTAAATEPGSIWKFVNVVRTVDFINETLERGLGEFVGRPMTLGTLDLIVQTGLQTLDVMRANGIILGSYSFGLATNNTATEGASGIVKFGMQFEVPAPVYDLRVTGYRNIAAYEALFNSVTGQFDIVEAA